MKKIFFLLAFCFLQCALAQDWTWMGGSNLSDQAGVYGSLGISSSTFIPGSRDYAVTLTDAQGNLWLFGGRGRTISTSGWGYLNDLWKYDPIANTWTMVNGSLALTPNYQNPYVPSTSTTMPTGRYMAEGWIDNNGNIWIYGGVTSSAKNISDLWKYNISNNQWTLMGGTTVPNASQTGSLGVASATAWPGSRMYGATWKDLNGNLWLFGGYTGSSVPSDLWKYDVSTNQWTWVRASSPGSFGTGIYGTMGIGSATTCPGERYACATWTDKQGYFWLYGGIGHGDFSVMNNYGSLGDLWRYDPANNQWAWMAGSPIANVTASHGTLNVESSSNTPGARINSVGWTDVSGHLLLFGGNQNWNDLWKYNIATGKWTWIKGGNSSNQPGTYGTLGVTSTTNTPGGRDGAGTWHGSGSTLWLFGGQGNSSNAYGQNNDFWKLDYCVGPTPVNTSGASAGVCAGNSATLSAFAPGTQYWYSTPTSNLPIASGSVYVTSVLSPGNYVVYTEATTCTLSPARTAIGMTIDAIPVVSLNSGSICAGQNFTLQPSGAASYSVQTSTASNFTLSTATSTISPSVTTTYFMTGKSPNGCASSNTAVATLSVFANPTITIGSGTICSGQSFSISTYGAPNFSYSGGSAVVTPTGTQSYTVTGISQEGCKASAISSVTVYPSPTITVNSGSICEGSFFTIAPSGVFIYTLAGGGSNTVSPPTSTAYVVFGVDMMGCSSNTAISSVTVHPGPVISVNSGSICSGQLFTLVPSGAASYTISGGSAVVNPFSTTDYSVSGTNSLGCISQIPGVAQVSVVQPPTIQVSSSSLLICKGESVLLSALGAATYSWSNGASGAAISVSPFSTTTFTVSGTDSNGCVNVASITQTVDACTSVAKLPADKAALSLYPNPGSGDYTLEAGRDLDLVITDALGRVVLQQQVKKGRNAIDLRNSAAGVYFIMTGSAERIKLIKQ